MTAKTAGLVGILLILVTIAVDIYLAADGTPGNTFSEMLRNAAKRGAPVLAWIAGVLVMHWFHPWEGMQTGLGRTASIALLVWLTWVIAIGGYAMHKMGHPVPPWSTLVAGQIAGALLWPV